MRAHRFVSALGLLALGGAVTAHADIKYQINGGTITTPSFDSGRAVVDLGAVTTDLTVHVFDDATNSTTGPSLDLDGIKLEADLGTPPAAVRIKLIVGNEDLETDFRTEPTDPMAPGVIDFGVLTNPPTQAIVYVEDNSNHEALRDAVILALAVSGNVEGHIESGRIWRVEASSTGTGLGLIKGSIDAYAKDDLAFFPAPANPLTRELGEYAINVITAARGIQGNIESKISGTDFSGGGIARVQVTGASDVVGIQGDIVSGKDIGSVFSAGPIGVAESNTNLIYAQQRIEQIRTVDGSMVLQSVSAHMDVRTGVMGTVFPTRIVGFDEGTPTISQLFVGDPSQDAPLGLIEVGGDYDKGNVSVLNLAPVPGLPENRTGIIVHGVLKNTDINIAYNLDYSKIVAHTIDGAHITVGVRMTGAIVEFGRDTTSPPSSAIRGGVFLIGQRGFEETTGTIPDAYEGFTVGMTGIDLDPVDMTQSAWWLTDRDGGTFDSLIRAGETKGGLSIFRMTLETEPGEHKEYMPRVEIATVAGEMKIGSMEAGVFWSGHVYDPAGLLMSPQQFDEADPEDYYCQLGNPTIGASGFAVIGCVSPTADLWLRDFTRVDISYDLLGELHVPELSDDFGLAGLGYQIVRIGERLGSIDDNDVYDPILDQIVCKCGSSKIYNTSVTPCSGQDGLGDCKFPCPLDPSESSPRGFAGGDRFALKGRVDVAERQGLIGQVVVNAANEHSYPDCSPLSNAASYWTGTVDVMPASGSTPIVLSANPGSCCRTAQPTHEIAVASYGGGDVGEVPYRVHFESSSPGYVRTCDVDPVAVLVSFGLVLAADEELSVAAVRYDGPMQELFDGGFAGPSLAVVERLTGSGWVSASDDFEVILDPTNSRQLLVFPLSTDPTDYVGNLGPIERYRVRPIRGVEVDGNNDPVPYVSRLVCDVDSLLPTSPVVPVSDETYEFVVVPDCNDNSIGDPQEILMAMMPEMLDCDDNGLIDTCEIAANASLDADMDGVLDVCEPSGCPGVLITDIDQNNQVDIADLIAFQVVWQPNIGLTVPSNHPADWEPNEFIDLADLVQFLEDWLAEIGCSI